MRKAARAEEQRLTRASRAPARRQGGHAAAPVLEVLVIADACATGLALKPYQFLVSLIETGGAGSRSNSQMLAEVMTSLRAGRSTIRLGSIRIA